MSFKDYLIGSTVDESMAQDKIHHNASINTIKNLAKNSHYKVARFLVHHDDKISAGDAAKCTHFAGYGVDDLVGDDENPKYLGYMKHNEAKDKYHYRLEDADTYASVEKSTNLH